ncbi:hypothetical protein KPL70_023450 [Citrus sinensis]|nr:hypothetical protein KPL70_023450 [Citrus sinensis]
MISAFSTQHKFQSKRYGTLLLQTNLSKANTVIPKPIQWKDVNLPNEWILEGATAPVIPKQLESNTELQNVTQYSDGKVKLSFRRTTSSRFSDKDSCSSIPSLERKFSKIPSIINLPFQPVKSQPRFSTSDIPSSSTHSVDYTTSVPHPIYTSSQHEQRQEEKEPSPPTSPTFSAITENIAPDSAQSSKISVLEHDNVSIASSDIEAFKDEPSAPKANKIHWELALPTVKTPPDLAIDNRPSALNQSRFNASSVYEWNIDGMSEYNILGLLQQMTMAANAYKTQAGTSDRAIAEILVAGFTGQLKGDPSHLRDKNVELLHNLRCRKLSEFQSYKTTFFTRIFLRDVANHITWKEKFLVGLPTLLGEKVRNSIKALYDNRIPYDELTYGELVSFVNKEGLKICQDLKLQKRLKWELRKSKQELESSDSESSMTGDSEPLQVDELNDFESVSSSDSDTSNSDSYLKKINVLTKDQETFLELIKHISDPNLQKEYLDKLLKTLDSNKAETSKVPIVKKNSYDLTEILDKKKTKKATPNIQDLQKEIKEIKLEIKELKEKQKNDSETIQLLLQKQLQDNSDKEVESDGDNEQNLENIESVPNDFLFVLKQITTRKYLIKIT